MRGYWGKRKLNDSQKDLVNYDMFVHWNITVIKMTVINVNLHLLTWREARNFLK